jgi:hypothetical protein
METRLEELKAIPDVRDRLVTIETKAALTPPPVDLAPLLKRLEGLEAQRLLPGPPGSDGRDGAAGKDGAPGAVGVPGPPGERGSDGLPGVAGRDGRDGLPGLPGEKGLPGLDGKDGAPGRDGLNGKDGIAGLSFEGSYQEAKQYEVGQVVFYAGASWHCNEPTSTKPGDSKAWSMLVKRGRDGKDGRDAVAGLPVVSVGSR